MKYFSITELCESDTARKKGVSNNPTASVCDHLIDLIENALIPIRMEWGSGIRISSGYRSATLNALVGGSKTSAHLTGYAADTVPANGRMKDYQRCVLRWAATHAFDQIILEYPENRVAKWIHIGIRSNSGQQRRQLLYTNNGRDYKTVTKDFY